MDGGDSPHSSSANIKLIAPIYTYAIPQIKYNCFMTVCSFIFVVQQVRLLPLKI